MQDGYAIFSNEGEVRCGLNDGVEYILHFGEIAGQSSDDEEESKDEAKEGADGDKPTGKDADKGKDGDKEKGVDRYIMVTTQFRQDLIAKPELQPLPEGYVEPAEEAAPAAEGEHKEAAKEGTAESGRRRNARRQTGRGPRRRKPPRKTRPKNPQHRRTTRPPQARTTTACCWRWPTMQSRRPKLPKTDAAPATEKPAEEAAAAEQKPVAPVDPDAAAEAAEKAKAALEAEAKRIKEDNKRKEDEYTKKVADGEKKVKDLNDRFADWYYVISDSTYKKIHISRGDLIKEKAKPADGATNPAGATGLPPGLNLPLQGLPK